MPEIFHMPSDGKVGLNPAYDKQQPKSKPVEIAPTKTKPEGKRP